MAEYQLDVTLDYVERLNNSHYGNPRYLLHFTDGSCYRSEPEAAFSYGITNSEYYDVPLRITVNGRRLVTYVEILEN